MAVFHAMRRSAAPRAHTSLRCALLLSLLCARLAAAAGGPAVVTEAPSLPSQAKSRAIRSVQLPSAIHRAVWLGSSNLTCNAKCQQGCLGLGAAEDARGPWHGDAVNGQLDFCLAGCGCAAGADRLLVTTEAGSAHLWTAEGNSWKGLAELLPAKDLKSAGAFRVEQMKTSLADPRAVVAITNATTSWLSRDGGAKWQPVQMAAKGGKTRPITNWIWHPSEKDWALAEASPETGATVPATAQGGAEAVAPVGRRHRRTVFYTQDGGASWKLLSRDVEQCHWSLKLAGNRTRILLTRYTDAASAGRTSAQVELVATSDFMASHTVLLGAGAVAGSPQAAVRVHIHSDFIAAAVLEGAATGASGGSSGRLELWLAADDGLHAPLFQEASWPAHIEPMRPRQLRQLQVLYAAEHMALLFVPAAEYSLPWGHIFSWTPGRPELELLLTDVHHPGAVAIGGSGSTAAPATGGLSFQPVAGVDGVFVANRLVLDQGQSDLDRAERRFDQQSEVASQQASASEDDASAAAAGEAEGQRFVLRTYISVNMGLAWQPLTAPSATADTGAAKALRAECSEGKADAKSPCSLHLARWSSAAAAPGMLFGVGNVGLRLSDNPEHHSVFLSRDAGLTWKVVLDGPHLVTILGHGDALVAVPLQAPTKLVYSLDSGSSWQDIAIKAAGGSTVVRSMFTHPAHTDLRGFVCFGSDASPGVTLAALDLSGSLFAGSCRLPEDMSNAASDFERWSPADALEDSHASKRPSCILGARTKYIRRKAGKACRTGAVKPAPVDLRSDSLCECTAADWACDVGFHRASYAPGAGCEPLEGVALPNVTAMCEATVMDRVAVTRGYAKLPGNACSGGLDLAPSLEVCPGNVGISGALKGLYTRLRSARMMVLGISIVGFLALIQARRSQSALGLKMRSCYGGTLGGRSKKKNDDELEEEREFLLPDGTA
eukprot:CAMPEP_0203848418 /NCGR_PEP_ID=MMETSP0359-20131031/5585_1 /ASSEMBLY_ACC=CAM_ASM_000338 /TAXON_ID=268821 /ORGANISM="Scrippsiella Hangoei, Strain SHTV-5" /LENGTH=944 /DNA_ID=CAMNT_0050764013 /DNA_START=111 /DNA_END=2945 /DNA_ORIENTATION=-